MGSLIRPMQIPFTPEVLLTGAIIAQGVFSAALLILHKNNKRPNQFLSLLTLLFSLWLCDTFFRVAEVYRQDPDFYFLPIYYSLAFGPLIYFYTRSLTEKDFQFKYRDGWHFLPVLFQAGFYLFMQAKDYTFRRWFWYEVHRPYTYDLEFNLSLISLLVYLGLSTKGVFQYQQWIRNRYSQLSAINLNWLKFTLGLLSVLALLWLVDALLREWLYYYPDRPFSAILMGLSVLLLAGGGLLQAHLSESKINRPEMQQEEKLAQSAEIDPDVLQRIAHEMATNRHYLDPQLSLREFAHTLGLPQRQVSFHINQGLGVSFIDFVNQHRVESVKQHLIKGDQPHLSLLGIALECGFNSKSTFNRVFKQYTGKNPSEYQKMVRDQA